MCDSEGSVILNKPNGVTYTIDKLIHFTEIYLTVFV